MATIATLLGLDPPAPERARVLELGCAGATNLIAMAGGLPDAVFVGVDSSRREIEEARTTIAALGRSNVTVHHLDLRALDASFGRFDYVIAHGLYSWIPETARERLLAICRSNLAPNGVAYVSYNTYPGWSVLRSIRDMMLYRTRHLSDPLERVAEAKRFVEFLAEALPPESGAFGAFVDAYARALRERWEVVDRQAAAAVLHDELSDVNEPTYFHRFVEEAARHGLQYLAEADLLGALPARHPPAVVESIRSMARDIVEAEQYLDFLGNRTFRHTLLCHQEIEIRRRIGPDPDRIASMYLGSQAEPEVEALELRDGVVARFRAPDGAVLAVDHAVTKAALDHLGRVFPDTVRFDELLALARDTVDGDAARRRDGDPDRDASVLAANALTGFTYSPRLVELNVHRPPFVTSVGERPVADDLARYLAARGHTLVTNARHERIRLDPFGLRLVPLLDGRRDLAALQDAMDEPAGSVQACLAWLAGAALLREAQGAIV